MSRLVSKKGFWADLKHPIMALSPMDGITDAACRLLIARCGKPDVMLTEFVSVDGLCSPGRKHLLHDFRYDESERPIVAQLFGNKPELFLRSAQLVASLGFDGVDINMGCPVKVVCKNGAGSALIQTPELATEVIQATIEGAGELPVSVKTRLGYNKLQTEEWTACLLAANPAAITFHLRTRKELSQVPAHWDEMTKIMALAAGHDVLILGNGDIMSLAQAEEVCELYGCHGVMIGRGIFGNPWLFNRTHSVAEMEVNERLDTMLEHCRLYEEVFGDDKKFLVMRKHLMAYASGFRGAKELRMSLEAVLSYQDVIEAVNDFRQREETVD